MKQQNGGGHTTAVLMGVAAGILGGKILPPLIATLRGTSRARNGADPFELLIEDHRMIISTLDQMIAAPQDSKVQRGKLLLILKRKLAKHALAEEDVVYPIVYGQAESRDQSKHLYDEHADMKIHLHELEQRVMSGQEWNSVVKPLRELIRHHVEEEEQQVFPQLRQRMGEAKLPKVAGEISREEALIV